MKVVNQNEPKKRTFNPNVSAREPPTDEAMKERLVTMLWNPMYVPLLMRGVREDRTANQDI